MLEGCCRFLLTSTQLSVKIEATTVHHVSGPRPTERPRSWPILRTSGGSVHEAQHVEIDFFAGARSGGGLAARRSSGRARGQEGRLPCRKEETRAGGPRIRKGREAAQALPRYGGEREGREDRGPFRRLARRRGHARHRGYDRASERRAR